MKGVFLMPYELSFDQDTTPRNYLKKLLEVYPYDIEAKIVYSLLEKDTYPHPSLLAFLAYFSKFTKYKFQSGKELDLNKLFQKMSSLKQRNKAILHTHQFYFDATFLIKQHKVKLPYAQLPLQQIPFIDKILLHTTQDLVMEHPYKQEVIQKSNTYIYKNISIDPNDFFALSMQIADKFGIVYIPRKELRMAIAISILYEICVPSKSIDFILLYGVASTCHSITYYFDETNQLYIGLISGVKKYHHFLYIKDMLTTLYNSICIEKRDLPIHGGMLSIIRDKKEYGVILMGEAQTGKSEILDSLKQACEKQTISYRSIFDDAGILHYLDNDISATGTQIGACIGVRDFLQERIFQQLSSLAMLSYNHSTTHILLPFSDHATTCKFHKVNEIIYLDNHSLKLEYHTIANLATAKEIFKIGTYKQNGKLKQSFFCNAFGCLQQYDVVSTLIDEFFNLMFINNLPLSVLSSRLTKQNKELLYQFRAEEILAHILEKTSK